MTALFDVLDKDKSGTISVQEFQQVLNSFGGQLTTEEIEELVRDADSSGDGEIGTKFYILLQHLMHQIDREEFAKLLEQFAE